MKIKLYKFIFLVALFLLLPLFSVQAATLFLSTKSGNVTIGDKLEVDVKIDSEDIGFNAAQATIQFPKDILEVSILDRSSSVFNLWLQDPTFSNQDGNLGFIGGGTSGFSGKSLEILKIIFKVKGSGTANLVFNDGAVTASDGSGTNILSAMKGIKIVSAPPQEISVATATVQIAKPVQIKRLAVPTGKLPVKPEVTVPLYSNQSKWYNLSEPFFTSWQLPADIVKVATAINKDPSYKPFQAEGLFDNKQFSQLDDGIWYLHVQFKNDIDWSPTDHYKISIDTAPPQLLNLQIDNSQNDNPTPTITYSASDALSGIADIRIFVDSNVPFHSTSTSFFKLDLQSPGKHKVLVRALDQAGNSAEQSLDFEVLPIETPHITSINKKVIIGTDDRLIIQGSAVPNVNIIITIEDENKFLVIRDETRTNSQGRWGFSLDKELRRGTYFISVKAKDSRGALSLSTEPTKVTFVDKSIISLFGLDITLRDLIIILVIAGILAASYFYRKTLLHLARSEQESMIINRDIKNAFGLIKENLNKISDIIKKDTATNSKTIEFNAINKKIVDTLDKIEKYSSKDIEKLK